MDCSKMAHKVREQLAGFLGIFSPRFPKPTMRVIGQMLYGIQAAQDVKLSQIGRELCEPIPIGKVENRLSRNLAREGMGLGEKLEILVSPVIDMSKRIHRVPEFFYYALADGIRRLFSRYGNGWGRHIPDARRQTDDRQLLLPLCFKPG